MTSRTLPFAIKIVAIAAAASASAAEPAPKLAPRAIPGLNAVKPVAAAPAAPQAPSTQMPQAGIAQDPATANKARVLFIRRRASLPAAMTADLPKSEPLPEKSGAVSIAPSQARPGKVRIIPKSEVAALLNPQNSEKPAPAQP